MTYRLEDQCEDLQKAVLDKSVALVYSRSMRYYGAARIMLHNLPRRVSFPPGPRAICGFEEVYFCPFSGGRLPGQLNQQWADTYLELCGMPEDLIKYRFDNRVGPKSLEGEHWWADRNIGPYLNTCKIEFMGLMEHEDPHPFYGSLDPKRPNNYFFDRFPGYNRAIERPPHFCRGVSCLFEEPDTMYAYHPHTREFGFRIIDSNQRVDHQPNRILPVPFCPMCGRPHPKSLRSEWEERVRQEGLDPEDFKFLEIVPDGWPKELTNETWWRSAGL